MFSQSSRRLKAKTLHEMFRKLKLQGAHPDVLWAVDAQKAQHNGAEMIRLETLMNQRSTTSSSTQPLGEQHFSLWLKPLSATRGHLEPHELLHATCTIAPRAPSRVVKAQLAKLFRDAGLDDDFEVDDASVEVNLEMVLRDADAKQTQHAQEANQLYFRGDRSIANLRKFGIWVVVEEDNNTFLVTLPENPQGRGGGMMGASGQIERETEELLRERGLRAFDLRMAGSYAAVERFVACFGRLERLYDQHRGRALRPCVCLVLSLKGTNNFVSEDGCIVLSVNQAHYWDEYLLALPQPVWKDCVALHQQWRLPPAPLLTERLRQLKRIADMLHVFGVVMEYRVAGSTSWQGELVQRLLREENSIRAAVRKYRMQSDVLKKRGYIHLCESLHSSVDPSKEIGFRVTGDGRLFLSRAQLTTTQMLKVLRDNLKLMERLTNEHTSMTAQLEHLSRSLPLDFSVDSDWKAQEGTNFVNCLSRFVSTIKENQSELARFLSQVMNLSSSQSVRRETRATANGDNTAATSTALKRLTWIVSGKFETMPSGVVFVPWDVDFESIKKMMLPR